jgi:hypothetical protein
VKATSGAAPPRINSGDVACREGNEPTPPSLPVLTSPAVGLFLSGACNPQSG